MKLLKRKPRTFEIQVQDMTLHIQAATDFNEESRAAALSFWEQLHAYTIRNPTFSSAKRPIDVPRAIGAAAPGTMAGSALRVGSRSIRPRYQSRSLVAQRQHRSGARHQQRMAADCGQRHQHRDDRCGR